MACHLHLAGILSTRVPFLIVRFLSIALKKHFVENLGTGCEGSTTCMWSKSMCGTLSCSIRRWHGLAAGHFSSSFLAKTPSPLQVPELLQVESWLKSEVRCRYFSLSSVVPAHSSSPRFMSTFFSQLPACSVLPSSGPRGTDLVKHFHQLPRFLWQALYSNIILSSVSPLQCCFVHSALVQTAWKASYSKVINPLLLSIHEMVICETFPL